MEHALGWVPFSLSTLNVVLQNPGVSYQQEYFSKAFFTSVTRAKYDGNGRHAQWFTLASWLLTMSDAICIP